MSREPGLTHLHSLGVVQHGVLDVGESLSALAAAHT